MAIVNNPALSIQASGDLGGINYSRWRGQAVARAKYSPVQPGSAAQLIKQANFTLVVAMWTDTLTDDQRDAWREFASGIRKTNRLGNTYQPTGYNTFIQVNMALENAGVTKVSVPPTDPKLTQPVNWDCWWSVSGGYVRCTYRGFLSETLDFASIKIMRTAGWDSNSRNPQDNDFLVKIYKTSGRDWDDNTVISGKIYWYRCQILYHDGFYGPIQQDSVTIP